MANCCCGGDKKPDAPKETTQVEAAGSCCAPKPTEEKDSCCGGGKSRIDWLLWGSLIVASLALALPYLPYTLPESLLHFSHGVKDLLSEMWWGIAFGILFIGFLSFIPREVVMKILGAKPGFSGILRATIAGVLLDLCSHGILMVGVKLYERGARLGQVTAFLVASPWNSLSLTIILASLVGVKLTLLFIFLSMVVALISGLIVDKLVEKERLPANPHADGVDHSKSMKEAFKDLFAEMSWSWSFARKLLLKTLDESRMVIRWLFFGVLLASAIRAFVPTDFYAAWFGASLIGLSLTLLAATIIEVCSEGSLPIAADLITRAGAPGNGFVFLMAGVATDYTEIMVLREMIGSFKAALFLPLITVPQIMLLGWLLNNLP